MRKVPSLRRHKPTSQAVVTLSGRDHYLGIWPANRRTPLADCQARYDRLIAEWLANGRQILPASDGGGQSPDECGTTVHGGLLMPGGRR